MYIFIHLRKPFTEHLYEHLHNHHLCNNLAEYPKRLRRGGRRQRACAIPKLFHAWPPGSNDVFANMFVKGVVKVSVRYDNILMYA